MLCTGHKYNIQRQLHLRKNNPNTTPTQKRVTEVEDAPPRARAENVFGARCVFPAVKVGGAKTTSLSPSRAPGVWGCRPLRGEPASISQRSVRCVSIPEPGGDSGRAPTPGGHPPSVRQPYLLRGLNARAVGAGRVASAGGRYLQGNPTVILGKLSPTHREHPHTQRRGSSVCPREVGVL